MTFALLVLLAITLLGALAGELRHLLAGDGLGHRPLPRSHTDEQSRELATWPR